MADYSAMIEQFGDWWGQDSTGMEDFMSKIAHHESGGTMNPLIHQYGGGPGRGLFQYEKTFKDKEGNYAQAGGMTARNRLAGWYEEQDADVPAWLNQEGMEDPSIGFDASLLDEEQQKMLFLADKRYDETASLRPDKIKDTANWWAKHHWKGGEEGSDIYKKRVSSFNEDLMMDDVVKEQGADAFGSKFGTGEGKIANFFKGVFE
tara:strand:- start:838 stop:1452 length:615 start_codon:yes stop_codon:yes gene_type:complete